MQRHSCRHRAGFTLIELLVVIGIIGLLAAITISAISPTTQISKAYNAQRQLNVNTILNALDQYRISNNILPAGIDTTMRMLGTAANGCNVTCGADTTAAACLDLTASLVPLYLAEMPTDPRNGSAASNYYAVKKDANNRLVVRACTPDLNVTIEVNR